MERPKTNPKMVVYLVGALKNKNVPIVANQLRESLGKDVEVFSSWYHSSPDADKWNLQCCKEQGLSYKETLLEWGSQNSYKFDKKHLNRAHIVIGLMKIGRSGHLEVGYSCGKGKKTYMFFAEGVPDRIDIMYSFLNDIFFDINDLIAQLKEDLKQRIKLSK